jgi:hypothetical protein
MTENKTSSSSPVTIVENAAERVALELAFRIASEEGTSTKQDRTYWLKLYHQCLKATTRGLTLTTILKE